MPARAPLLADSCPRALCRTTWLRVSPLPCSGRPPRPLWSWDNQLTLAAEPSGPAGLSTEPVALSLWWVWPFWGEESILGGPPRGGWAWGLSSGGSQVAQERQGALAILPGAPQDTCSDIAPCTICL